MRQQRGFTLIEIMLVVVIAGLITLMGINQYFSYKLDSDASILKSNVDVLFAAMSSYFQAQCGGTNGALSPYNLANSPATNPNFFTTPISLNITNNLATPGFLQLNQLLYTSLVVGNPGTPLDLSGYSIQFVPQAIARVAPPAPQGSPPVAGTSPARWNGSSGSVIVWIPQIVVTLRNPAQSNLLSGMTNAAGCITSPPAPGARWTQITCTATTNGLLFFHQTSFTGNVASSSDYWIMNSSLGQLRDQERNYNPMVASPTGTLPSGATQYSYCGS